MQVLVGVDGGTPQADAVRLAARLAAAGGGRVIAATTRRDSGAVLDLAGEQLRGVEHMLRPMPGMSPAEALHELAATERADVLVIGSTHRGRLGRTLLGSTGDRVLHGSPCPVAVAPRGYAHVDPGRPLARIAVAYDGAPESRAARAFADRLAALTGATVTDVTIPAHAGPVAPALVAASADADLLVCGSRDHGPIGQVLLGGVSRKLMHDSAAPLVVVPRSSLRANPTERASQSAAAG